LKRNRERIVGAEERAAAATSSSFNQPSDPRRVPLPEVAPRIETEVDRDVRSSALVPVSKRPRKMGQVLAFDPKT
jgi:hypothetical protein